MRLSPIILYREVRDRSYAFLLCINLVCTRMFIFQAAHDRFFFGFIEYEFHITTERV